MNSHSIIHWAATKLVELIDAPSGGVSGQPLTPPDLCLACKGLFCQGDWIPPIVRLRVLERLSEVTRAFPCPLTSRKTVSVMLQLQVQLCRLSVCVLLPWRFPHKSLPFFFTSPNAARSGGISPSTLPSLQLGKGWSWPGGCRKWDKRHWKYFLSIIRMTWNTPVQLGFSAQKFPFPNPGETKDHSVFSIHCLLTQVISYLNSISAVLIPAFH